MNRLFNITIYYYKYIYSIIVCLILSTTTLNLGAQPAVKKEGYNKLYYPSGKLASEGVTKNGKPEGIWKNYYENGKLKSMGNRENFLLDGIWKFYNTEGELLSEISYYQNEKNGYTWNYENGKLTLKSYYTNNLKNGEELSFYETGVISVKNNFVNGLKEGSAFEYGQDARIITLLKYNKDLLVSRDEINRYNTADEREGKWVEFHDNGINKLVGNYSGNKKTGLFKEYNKEGKLIAIYNYDDGELLTKSAANEVLQTRTNYYANGQIKNTATYRDSLLQGFYKEFDKAGNLLKSTLYDKGLRIAEGELDSIGREQGKWTYFYENQQIRAEGKYKDGKKIELWNYYFPSGILEQTGNYEKGLATGQWLWYYENKAKRREENYLAGKEEGMSEEYDVFAEIISKGRYVNGLKTGKWLLQVGDYLEEGKYRSGEKDGNWLGFYLDEYNEEKKKVFEGGFKDGFADGKHEYFFLTGILKETRFYTAGEPSGTWTLYNEDGSIYLSTNYENGDVKKVNGVQLKGDKKVKEN